ncbi:MAG: hypothetical protein DMF98_28405 [Acidobacteria bacterium]|nr:MAG: hypothetical protein DMF98_28405 [Acidobacteriota bacterium]
MAVAVALLVVCELKAARRYPVTANALDAAAIAILFATFYAAHALWQLIPAIATFMLLAVVTALAVLLSIRRGSMFIAVLGLLGGFATPALLSTGENRPIPLFAYLMLLNIGLAWVAYRQVWPVLTWLTLILTTLYQWGWVMQFLRASGVSLAMGVFLIFPIAAVAGLLLAPPRAGTPQSAADRSFERTAALSAALPLLFLSRRRAGVWRECTAALRISPPARCRVVRRRCGPRPGTAARRRRSGDAPRDGSVAGHVVCRPGEIQRDRFYSGVRGPLPVSTGDCGSVPAQVRRRRGAGTLRGAPAPFRLHGPGPHRACVRNAAGTVRRAARARGRDRLEGARDA